MTSGRLIARWRRAWPWALLGLAGLLLIVFGWNVAIALRAVAAEGRAVRGQVLEEGRYVRAVAERSAYRTPQVPLSAQLERRPGPFATVLRFRQAVLFFGERVLWADPEGPPWRAKAPAPRTDLAVWQDGAWLYLWTLEDGRLFEVRFDAPAYDQLRAQRLLLAAFLAGAACLLLAVSTGAALRLRRRARGRGGLGLSEEVAVSDQVLAGATPALAQLFQQTLAELRRRSEELEAMHRQERLRAEDVEGMAEALFANLEAGYLRFDREGRLAGVNAPARALLGVPHVPRLGDRGEQILAGRPEVLGALEEARASRSLVLLDEVPGAGETLLQVVAVPLLNRLHQSRGHLLVVRDLTSVYQMRRTLRDQEALSRLGEVAAGVAHEVRNALNTLTVRLRLLGQDLPTVRENPQYEALAQEAANLEQVVNDLLFYAKPLPTDRETVALAPVLEEAARQMGQTFPAVRVTTDCPEDLEALADPDALGRCLHNLCRNAGEALGQSRPGAGQARLSAREGSGGVEVLVEDDGPGVPTDAAGRLFTPFFSQKPGGTGLGLAIARKIAREHGGDLVYFDSGLGGAGFLLTLPAKA